MHEITRTHFPHIPDLKMQANAANALHEAAEAMMVTFFPTMVLGALHAHRITITLDDPHNIQCIRATGNTARGYCWEEEQ